MCRYTFTFSFLICLFLISCTGNTLFDDEIDLDEDLKISGKVTLDDSDNYKDIFVWMEGFECGTWTDINGNFSFQLPEPAQQPNGGLNGIFQIYFFCADYKFKTASFLLIDGKVQKNKGDVDDKGKLKTNIVLNKLLDIVCVVSPTSLNSSATNSLEAKFHLENKIDTVEINTFKGSPNTILLKPANGSAEDALILFILNNVWTNELITSPITWEFKYNLPENFLEPGNYEIIPIIEVVQEDLPKKILKSIGNNVYSKSTEYLKLPFRSTPAKFSIYENTN